MKQHISCPVVVVKVAKIKDGFVKLKFKKDGQWFFMKDWLRPGDSLDIEYALIVEIK